MKHFIKKTGLLRFRYYNKEHIFHNFFSPLPLVVFFFFKKDTPYFSLFFHDCGFGDHNSMENRQTQKIFPDSNPHGRVDVFPYPGRIYSTIIGRSMPISIFIIFRPNFKKCHKSAPPYLGGSYLYKIHIFNKRIFIEFFEYS